MKKYAPRMFAVIVLLLIVGIVLFKLNAPTTHSGSTSHSHSGSTSHSHSTAANPSIDTDKAEHSGPNPATTTGRVGDAALYPDPKLTPGDVIPGVTEADVCKPGYAGTVRDVSQAEKDEVYRRYGLKNVTGEHEVDHFISLELGGSNDISNLWPEFYEPRPGAHEKDRVENWLHKQVCDGNMTLAEAQRQIRTDWYAVYLNIPKKSPRRPH